MLVNADELSEFEDATLSVLGDPELEASIEGADFYNFFFLKARAPLKPLKRGSSLFFFDQSFFFCEEGLPKAGAALFVDFFDTLSEEGWTQAEFLEAQDLPEDFEVSFFEDIEDSSIELLFFSQDGSNQIGPFAKQDLLEDYFIEEFGEGEEADEGAEEVVDDPVDALVLEAAHSLPYAEEDASATDEEGLAPSFEKNFLPFFFVLKRLKSFFFFRNVFSFFFFFLPLELVNLVYADLEEELEALPTASSFFFETLKGPKAFRELNSAPLSLVETLQNYKYEPSKQGKNRSYFFFLFLSRFFNHKLKEDFCLSVVSTRGLQREFGLFVLKYSSIIKPFFEHMTFFFNTTEFIEVFFLCLKVKDLSALATYVKTLFERIQIKFHKTFLRKLDLFLTFFFEKLRHKFGVKGFLMDVRGKVSVVGNSKKRHVCIKKGYLSKTKKELRFFFLKNQINTTTGVLGASYLLSF